MPKVRSLTCLVSQLKDSEMACPHHHVVAVDPPWLFTLDVAFSVALCSKGWVVHASAMVRCDPVVVHEARRRSSACVISFRCPANLANYTGAGLNCAEISTKTDSRPQNREVEMDREVGRIASLQAVAEEVEPELKLELNKAGCRGSFNGRKKWKRIS